MHPVPMEAASTDHAAVDAGEGRLRSFLAEIGQAIPEERIRVDEFSRYTLGTDASFYRLIPKAVVIVESEAEVVGVCLAATRWGVPITFRAAGTSLSGQAVTDWVLVKLGHDGWRTFEPNADGSLVRLGPGLAGGHVNARLGRFGRKIGPDPASIGSAMIGGIAANNSSGMCCGTAQNTYKTLLSMRLVLADGTVLDTADEQSKASFARTHADVLASLAALGRAARQDETLRALIERKYAIKNTTGYSLNALIDFADPFEILEHLMVGSEGTLGFISEVRLRTVHEPPAKSAALVFFPTMRAGCEAAIRLATEPVSAVEMMDYASLQSVAGKPGVPAEVENLPDGSSALLIDIRADSSDELARIADSVLAAIAHYGPLAPPDFVSSADMYAAIWAVRKGLLPSVGASRPAGTTVIVEDIAVPLEHMADAAIALRELLGTHGYDDGIIFGHALDGNLHFVFPQGFGAPEDVARYVAFFDDLTQMVAVRFGGSLKAEHGTGRNMAPFVELEWGRTAYELMWRIKRTFDPHGVLNPGVILSTDPEIHVKALKVMPVADPLIDRCIECGFCEAVCPSRALTLTPRQRIVATREIASREQAGQTLSASFADAYGYEAIDTCAGDGLCALNCPVGIDTGELMRSKRAEQHGHIAQGVAGTIKGHIGMATAAARAALAVADISHAILGPATMTTATDALRKLSGNRTPQWTPQLPPPARRFRDER
jgi:D-lactate dehydrogenase